MIRLRWLVAFLLLAACSSAVAEPISEGAGADETVAVEALIADPEPTVAPLTGPTAAVLTTTPVTTIAPTSSAATVSTTALVSTSAPAPASTIAAASTTRPSVAYNFEVLPIEGLVRDRVVETSWREGCPLSLEELRYLTVSYVDFNGEVQEGELIVAEAVAADVVEIFRSLFEATFPIERMQLVSDFGSDDLESMLANNTSGFNCRFIEGTQRWSEHAFGQAVDVNPLINPWVRGDVVSPAAGAEFANRTVEHKGGIYRGSDAVAAFAQAGWLWGGSWRSTKDYQHFSTSGR